MHPRRPNLFTRDDTMFGVCQGIGEDLGFNPNYLRAALPLLLFVFPVATIIGYLLAGLVVFTVHSVMPSKWVERPAPAQPEHIPAHNAEELPLPLAA